MERDELSAWLRLTLTPGIGNATARKLLGAFGLPAAVFAQSQAALTQVVPSTQANALRVEPEALASLVDRTWEWLQPNDALSPPRHIVALGDHDYPPALLAMDDPPLLLYLLGSGGALLAPSDSVAQRLSAASCRSLAVVGSRNPTPQGLLNARHFSKALVQAGLTVVSGLALGVDGAAHEGALDGLDLTRPSVATVAVVGTGLDRVYPRAHRELAHRIAKNGILLSEYPLGTPPLTANFPKRNRLIAGLSTGTLVVEAALKSGSLITARLSVEQGREVFAIPGSIHAPQSKGCHALIKQGAKLVESAQDILEELPLASKALGQDALHPEASTTTTFNSLTAPESALLVCLGYDPVGLDALQARSDLDTASLQAQLMSLELDGLVGRLPGGLFQRLAKP